MGGGESSKGRLLSVPLHPRAVTVDAVLLYILLPLSLSHSPSSSFTTTHSDLFLPNVHCFCGGAKWGTPLRPPSSAGWNEPPPLLLIRLFIFYFSPNSLCLLSSFFVVACIVYPERRCKVVGPSSFLAVLIIRGTLAQLTDNKQWQEVVDAIAFLFSAFLPPLGVSLPTQELSLVFFLFTFFFLSISTQLRQSFSFLQKQTKQQQKGPV